MGVDNYLEKIAPWSWVTHTARGVNSMLEYNKFIDGILYITCREIHCRTQDTSSLSQFFEQPYLLCSNCGSSNITAEWIEQQPLGQIIIPGHEEGFPIDSQTDPFYGMIYHMHYQRDIL